MLYLKQEATRLQSELQALVAQQAPLDAQLATQQQAVTADQAQRTNAVNAVAQAQARIPPLQAASTAADAHVADVEQEIQDVSEPPQEGPTPAWRTRLTALKRTLVQAKAAATTARTSLTEAQRAVAQAQAQVQAAESQVAVAAAAVQATQAAIGSLQTLRRDLQQRLAELDRWEEEITRDPLVRPALEQTAAELSARVAGLEDAHLTTRFELEDAEALLATLMSRRDDLVTQLNAITAQLPDAQAQAAAAQQALATAEAEVTAHLQDGP